MSKSGSEQPTRNFSSPSLANSKEVGLVLGNRQILRVARKDIALNEQNMR
jgi:hypothetical protein